MATFLAEARLTMTTYVTGLNNSFHFSFLSANMQGPFLKGPSLQTLQRQSWLSSFLTLTQSEFLHPSGLCSLASRPVSWGYGQERFRKALSNKQSLHAHSCRHYF